MNCKKEYQKLKQNKMWIVIKFKRNQYEFLQNEIRKKLVKVLNAIFQKLKLRKK